MRLSLNWLSDYLSLPNNLNINELSETITTSIAEIEGHENIGQEGILIGKIIELKKHPQADRLTLATVSTGKQEHRVVCGGTNLKQDMLIAFAPIGTKVKWHGEGDWVMLEKATIRGETSEGMICASNEIGLPVPCGEKEITDLTPFVSEKDIGKNVYEVLNLQDIVFEVDNKSLTHRPDLFGHYGFARDVYAVLKNQKRMKIEFQPYPQTTLSFGKEKLDISIQTKNCRRFCAVKISNIKVQESPLYLKSRLEKIGIRPINNIVDITNYVMFDLGQPMHAYDVKKLKGEKLIVRQAKKGESMLGLDEKKYTFTEEDVVIYDAEKAVDIAGIMGGEESGIDDATTDIILESASFSPVSVRKTSQRLGVRSEASARFEKNLDPEYTLLALNKAISLIKELLPESKITSELFDQYDVKITPATIILRPDYLAKKIGIPIPEKTIQTILEDVGCIVKKEAKNLSVTVPSWRATKDLTIEDDLIEEVARIYGYHNIPFTAPRSVIMPAYNYEKHLERKIRNICSSRLGFFEVTNYPFTNEKESEKFGQDKQKLLALKNILASHQTHLKTTLVPDLLKNAKENIHQYPDFWLFEIGKLYYEEKGEVAQKKKIAGIAVQEKKKIKNKYDDIFFLVKEKLEILFTLLHAEKRTYHSTDRFSFLEKGKSAVIMINDKEIGSLGIVKEDWKKEWDLENSDVALFECDYDMLQQSIKEEKLYSALPKFPPVVRHLAFVLDKTVSAGQIKEIIEQSHENIAEVELFDVYESEALGKDKKSLTYQLTYLDPEKTLEEKEIENITGMIIKNVEKAGGKLREI